MIGYKKMPHVGKDVSTNSLIINYDDKGLEYDLTLSGTLDCVVSHRRELNIPNTDRYKGYLTLKDLERDTSSNEPILQPHAVIGVGFRLKEKVRVFDMFRHTCESKSTTGHVVASMLGIQQGFYFARPWRDSPFKDWMVFLPAHSIIINGVEQDNWIKTIEGNGLDDIIEKLPKIRLSLGDNDYIFASLLNADGTRIEKKDIEIYLETTTGILQENRLITNEFGQAQTKLLFKGKGKVKAGFKFYTGIAEIEI